MGSTHSASGQSTAAKKPLRWLGLVSVVLLFSGLWIFSDWLFVWSGYDKAVDTEATVVKSVGVEGSGSSAKYRHVIRYGFPGELLDSVLPPGVQARKAAFDAERAASDNANLPHGSGITHSQMSVLLDAPHVMGTTVPVEYYQRKPWELYRVDGHLQVASIKKYYLFYAVILLLIVLFAGRRTRRR